MVLRLILDTNRIISALISDKSIIRDILLSDKIEFYCPEHLIEEIEKYKGLIRKKSSLTEIEFYFTLYYLLKKVKVVKKEEFAEKLPEAKEIMKDIDIKDSEFLALAMTIPNDGIFSDDKHFDKINIKRWKVEYILDWLKVQKEN